MIWRIGDLVETWFDTGAMDYQILYGRIVAPTGLKRATVTWQSGIRQRIENGRHGVQLARNQELARDELKRIAE